MKIEATPEEIAALVVGLQERRISVHSPDITAAKEVFESSDVHAVHERLQSGKWAAMRSYLRANEVVFILFRFV